MQKVKEPSMVAVLGRLMRQAAAGPVFVLIFVLYLVMGASSIAVAWGTGSLVSAVVSRGGALDALANAALLLGAGKLVYALAEWQAATAAARLSARAGTRYRLLAAAGFANAEFSWIGRQKTGDLLNRVQNDVLSASLSVSHFLPLIARSAIIALVVITVMAFQSWLLALIFLLPQLVSFILLAWGARLAEKRMVTMTEAYGAAGAKIQDVVNNRTTIKAYRLEKAAEGWVAGVIDRLIKTFTTAMTALSAAYTPSTLASRASMLLLCGVGCAQVATGRLDTGVFIAVLSLAETARSELSDIGNFTANVPRLVANAKRLFPMWDAPRQGEGAVQAAEPSADALVFEDIHFAYPAGEEEDTPPAEVLRGFGLVLKRGERVALVGPSGCGKSTVLKLAAGLYAPGAGRVQLFGHTPRSYTKAALGGLIGNMAQDTFLFPGSVRDNICIAGQGAGPEALARAVAASGLGRHMGNLANGLDTDVGERGAKLSGGQRQMVAIARMLLHSPPLLLLDEATSALDTASEQAVNAALRDAGRGRAVLMVTHRLTATTDADRIVVMDGGRVVEQGRHEALLEQGGLYARLWRQEREEAERDG